MAEGQLSRRALLALGWAGPWALLAGCSRERPRVVARRGDLPDRWARRLPNDWQVRWLPGAAEVREACAAPLPQRPALAQLADGWATAQPPQAWAPFGHGDLLGRLDPTAASASRLFRGPDQVPLAFPWSVNPWVILLRDRPDLAKRGAAGWDLLLDPTLTGQVVLPSSPRVVMALVRDDPQRLCRLRRQALAHNDRHGIALLLSGEAQAAVVPRPQVVPLLRRDPRLTALLPPEGSPLSWSLLLRPAGVEVAPPEGWLEAILQPSLLPRWLAGGWVPPLPRSTLAQALEGFPPALAELLLPPDSVLNRCVPLPPLAAGERQRLQELWNGSQPCQAP
ncbi:MAG: twin-arginine translocation pathway signal [Cyanobacteriota bacterium]|nr:twin-arginine translocation pathway signal [Cyanobacteriota bacterium]